MLRDDEYQKCDKNREVHIRRDNLWIQNICLKCMHQNYHDDHSENYLKSTMPIRDENDRNP